MKAWIGAARPKTLGAIAGPCAIAAGLTVWAGEFDPIGFGVAFVGGGAVQVLTNLVNDLVDGVRGTDGPGRLGPPRAVASGLATPGAVAIACVALALVALGCGAYLALERSPWFAPMALLSLALALTYSAGPLALSYTGLADPFALLFFGPVACAGAVAAQTGRWDGPAWWLGLGPGGFALAMLAVNNLRDVDGDRAAGKLTLAVRLGAGFARAEIVAGVLLAMAVAALAALDGTPAAWMAAAAAALAAPALVRIARGERGVALNRELHWFGALALLYGLLMAVAVGWQGAR